MSAGNGQPLYTVSTPSEVRERLRPWAKTAARLGVFNEFLADLGEMNTRLVHSPKHWGDPLKNFSAARLRLYRGLTEYLIVMYAVHTEQRLVFVKDITLRPDRPLGQTEEAG